MSDNDARLVEIKKWYSDHKWVAEEYGDWDSLKEILSPLFTCPGCERLTEENNQLGIHLNNSREDCADKDRQLECCIGQLIAAAQSGKELNALLDRVFTSHNKCKSGKPHESITSILMERKDRY